MTDVSRERLAKAATVAVDEAAVSREQLGRTRAVEFRAAPDRFDPRSLLILGSTGLKAFASEIGISDLVALTVASPTGEAGYTPSRSSGWSDQQCNIVPFERFGAVAGILAGLILICTVSMRAWLNA